MNRRVIRSLSPMASYSARSAAVRGVGRSVALLARGALVQWFWADTRQQVPGLSLALMALLLALAANIGVGTMVSSFRQTFVGWLDQRLAVRIAGLGLAAMAAWGLWHQLWAQWQAWCA